LTGLGTVLMMPFFAQEDDILPEIIPGIIDKLIIRPLFS